MTSKLTITDERVISVIERLEHYACNLKWTNVRGAQDLLTAADGLRELQERRKAAMDSEPAMESEQLALENLRSAMEGIGHIRRTLEETFGGLHGTHVEPDVLAECKAICDAIYAAYGRAQPAPVVMDDRKLRSLFDSWFASDCSFDLSPEASEADNIAWRESYWYVWQRCRAAMLQAGTITNEGTKQAWTGIPDIDNAINMLDRIDTLESCDDDRVEAVKTVLRRLAGNSPVIPDSSASMLRRWLVFGRGMQNAGSQLPHNLIAETEEMLAAAHCIIPMISDRWVPVSERVPTKQDGSVFLTWNGQYIGKELFLMGSFQCLKPEIITHWMPLPAAPQEVKSES